MITHPAAQLLDEVAETRLVIEYAGLNSKVRVYDGRQHIRIRITGLMPAGLSGGLRAGGFKLRSGTKNTWERPHSPAAIMEAQAIVQVFFGGDDA